jgi:hypothetical protein
MALAPLYSHYAAANKPTSSPAGAATDSSSSSSRPAAPGALPWDPDYVVFLNDVFFCWGMVLRLMGYRADITCGMDFWQNRGEHLAVRAVSFERSTPSLVGAVRIVAIFASLSSSRLQFIAPRFWRLDLLPDRCQWRICC